LPTKIKPVVYFVRRIFRTVWHFGDISPAKLWLYLELPGAMIILDSTFHFLPPPPGSFVETQNCSIYVGPLSINLKNNSVLLLSSLHLGYELSVLYEPRKDDV